MNTESKGFRVWIDGIGSYLVRFGQRVSLGRYHPDEEKNSEIALLAKLSQQHATIIRNDDGYVLEGHAATKVNGHEILGTTILGDGYEIELGESVKLSFHLPTALSLSARLDFLSDHRPPLAVDGIVLMDETCLLGPGSENHIRCHDWPGSVLFYRNQGAIWCKSRLEIFSETQHVSAGVELNSGDVIHSPEIRFRIDAE